MRNTPTIRDVAKRAGVSVATASIVVNGNRPVGEASRKAVLAAISELGYRLNSLASALRARRSRLIVILVPDVANVFFASLVHCIEIEAARSAYELVLVTSGEDVSVERRRIEALVDRQIDGLLAAPARDNSLAAFRDRAGRLILPPTVLIDRGFGAPGFDSVGADCAAAGYAATRHLIGLGHRDIAVLTHSNDLSNIRSRIAGYRRALAEPDLAPRERICVGGHLLEGLRGAIEQELHRADPPTAIFALTNISALAAIKAMRACGLDIPGDISVVGFDDFDWMSALRPYLTRAAQPVEECACRAWRQLIQRISGEEVGAERAIELPCSLRIRESTGPVRIRLRAVSGA